MTTTQRLESLKQRKTEVRRELDDLAAAKTGSANAALAELESALVAELDRIDRQIRQIQTYMGRCHPYEPP